MTEHTIGVDILASYLDVFDAARDASLRFKNSAIGFCALEKWLGKAQITHVMYDSLARIIAILESAFAKNFPW